MNKIKGSSSAVKMKYLLFVFAAAVLVTLPTRVYQLLALVDATNGFYTQSDVTVPVLYGVIVVFSLLFIVLSFVSKEVPSPKLPTGKNPILGIASFIMAAGLGYDMFAVLTKTIPVNQGSALIFINLLRSNFSAEGGIFVLLQFVFAFFAIIYFLVFGISHLNGKASYKEFKLLALSPLCWAMTILVTNLMNAISFIKVSELLFEIFMFVFTMLFFLTFARISSGVFTEDSMWGIYGYGLTASLLAAIVTIPRVVIMLVGLDAVEGNEFNFVHLTVFIFILAYIFASLGVGFKDGLKKRREVSEIDLPDDAEVIKKDDFNLFFDEADEEASDAEEDVAFVEAPAEETVIVEEASESVVEIDDEGETFSAPVEEVAEEHTEGIAEELPEEVVSSVEEEPVFEESVFAEEITEAETEAVEYEAEDFPEEPEVKKEKKKSKLSAKGLKKNEEKNEPVEMADDMKPISLADLKNKNKE